MTRKRLTPDQARSIFTARINTAAKALRAISNIVDEDPSAFRPDDAVNATNYLQSQLTALQLDLTTAITTVSPAKAPFSLDGSYGAAVVSAQPKINVRELVADFGGSPPIAPRVPQTPVAAPVAAPELDIDADDEDALDALEETTAVKAAAYAETPVAEMSPLERRRKFGKAVGRLAGSKEVLFSHDEEKPTTFDDPSERPDAKGIIKDAGFID